MLLAVKSGSRFIVSAMHVTTDVVSRMEKAP